MYARGQNITVTLLFKGCVCMLLKVFHSHCTDNLLVKLHNPDVMLWLCIRSPGYCCQLVPYAYIGILRSRLPIHKMLQCAALVLPIVLKLCSNKAFWDVLFNIDTV